MGVVDLELLIVVKSYPNPSQSLGEATCVVGICKDRGFVRLYPVPFRKLEDEQQFSKYQVIRFRGHVLTFAIAPMSSCSVARNTRSLAMLASNRSTATRS